MRDVLIRGVVSFQRDNLVVFYLTSVFEFWSDKRVVLGGIDLILGTDRCRNTPSFLTKNVKEIFWDLNFLSEVTGCRKT
jgi:hypothetical protein